MLVVRVAILLALVAAGVFFAVYAGTGQVRFRRYGLVTLTWTLVAALVFFAVLAAQRLA
jgi:hypothetical protein